MRAAFSLLLVSVLFVLSAQAAWQPVKPREALKPGEVAVSGPGNYAKAGTTYVLTKDITSPTSAIFLGKDVTLDLNGHTITYADGKYEHLPNSGFEEGLKGWDTSKCPKAKVLETALSVPFIGKKLLKLPAGEELISPFINLPVANRSYYAMVGVISHKMRVSVNVDDEKGNPLKLHFKFGSRTRQTCPENNRPPKLGGGFVFAHLHGIPAGKYRIRIKAEKNCLIDEVDIRPAMDVGIGVVDKTLPWAYYKCILDGDGCAFFDYNKKGAAGTPVDSVPRVTGSGTITIKNGVIRSGFEGIRSWGLLSTARGVMFKLENLKFQAAGINTNAVSVGNAKISNCRFEIDTPFIIDRHRRAAAPACLSHCDERTEVSGCEFIGGQGNLTISGSKASVHDNLFVNHQTVTNHYSLGCDGKGGHRVFRNRFEPKQGSGIYIYRSQNNEIFENTFKITASPPTCEYGHADYSVSAVRISDYNAKPGSKKGICANNKLYKNKLIITGKDYPEARKSNHMKKYEPAAYGFYISVGGGTNFVYENEIKVNHLNPGTRSRAYAFYIGGSDNGGEVRGNKITTNTPAFWIANSYGRAGNVLVEKNTIIKASDAPSNFKPIRIGFWTFLATNITFRGNTFENCSFGVSATEKKHTWKRE